MPQTTLTIRHDVAKRLRANRAKGESYSDMLVRLLDNQPARTVGEWLDSLAPLEGRGLFSPEERECLKRNQRHPRESSTRRRNHAVA